MYDCGESHTATGYKDVSDSTDAAVVAARERLIAVLKDLPGPDGHAGLRQPGADGKAKGKGKGKGKKKAAKAAP